MSNTTDTDRTPHSLLAAFNHVGPHGKTNRTVPILLPIVVLFFFLVGFFTIYLFRDLLRYLTAMWIRRRRARQGPSTPENPRHQPEPPRGLPPALLASFPLFSYTTIKRMRKRKWGLVCAVCLSEFVPDDKVRLITVCSHAFHPDCIDPWLVSHVTCPICRCNLEKMPVDVEAVRVDGEESNSHAISVEDEYTVRLPPANGGSGSTVDGGPCGGSGL